MPRQVIRCLATGVFLALTGLSAPAQSDPVRDPVACSTATLVGTYNYQSKGISTFHERGKVVPHAAQGTVVFDGIGNYLMNKISKGGGTTLTTTNAKGTYTVDTACNYIGKRVHAEDNQLHVSAGVVKNGGNFLITHSEHSNQSAQATYTRVLAR